MTCVLPLIAGPCMGVARAREPLVRCLHRLGGPLRAMLLAFRVNLAQGDLSIDAGCTFPEAFHPRRKPTAARNFLSRTPSKHTGVLRVPPHAAPCATGVSTAVHGRSTRGGAGLPPRPSDLTAHPCRDPHPEQRDSPTSNMGGCRPLDHLAPRAIIRLLYELHCVRAEPRGEASRGPHVLGL